MPVVIVAIPSSRKGYRRSIPLNLIPMTIGCKAAIILIYPFLILSIILLAASVLDSIWLILNAMRYVFKL